MKKITSFEGLKEIVGKRVKAVLKEDFLPSEVEGLLIDNDSFIDLDGSYLETDMPYTIVFNKYYDGVCTYIGIDNERMNKYIESVEVINEYTEEVVEENIIEKIKKVVRENYDSEKCGATSEWSDGNSDDVFSDGEDCGKSWLAYEIGQILGMELDEPAEQKYSWED